MVAALPVDLAAVGTLIEIVIVFSRQGLKLIQNFFFHHDLDQAVAQGAAVKRGDALPQIEPVQNFRYLPVRFHGTDPVAVFDLPMEQQAAVAGENDALFCHADIHDFPVFQIIAPECVKTQQA